VIATRRNRRPRPPRTLSVGKPCNGCFAIRIAVGKESSSYFVEPLPCDFGRAAFRLVKFDCDRVPGEPDAYEVLIHDTRTDSVCPCRGFEKHGWHLDAEGKPTACKHLDALLALVADGRLALPNIA
jgi:hypothetical protein